MAEQNSPSRTTSPQDAARAEVMQANEVSIPMPMREQQEKHKQLEIR